MGLNYDKLKQTRTRSGGTGWKPREGENRIRVLPPGMIYFTNPDEMDNLAVAFKMHFFKREGQPTEVSRCLRDLGRRCPACDMWRVHRDSPDPGLKTMAKDISPSDQYLFNILDLSNIARGIQVFTSNWTCWDKIMEIGANQDWGDIVSPEQGINFVINKIPGNKSRSGYPSYSVMPEPSRTTVMPILDTIENWRDVLDQLEGNIAEAKEPSEIIGFLSEMGFPDLGGMVAPSPSPTPSPQPSIPGPGSAPPPPSPQPAPAPAPSPAPSPQPAPAPLPGPGTPPPPAQVAEEYPECFGGYDPSKYPCPSCQVMGACQEKMLGIDD